MERQRKRTQRCTKQYHSNNSRNSSIDSKKTPRLLYDEHFHRISYSSFNFYYNTTFVAVIFSFNLLNGLSKKRFFCQQNHLFIKHNTKNRSTNTLMKNVKETNVSRNNIFYQISHLFSFHFFISFTFQQISSLKMGTNEYTKRFPICEKQEMLLFSNTFLLLS